MLFYHVFASEYLAAVVGRRSTHQSVLVYGQLLDGLDDLTRHLRLASILDHTGPSADLVCYCFGLLPLGGMGALHMVSNLAGQNAVSALFTHCQRILCFDFLSSLKSPQISDRLHSLLAQRLLHSLVLS